MKDYLELIKQPLTNHVERPFFTALKFTAKEHGYTGFLSRTRFLYRRSMDHFLQVISRIVPYSGLRIVLHRWRGVKIGEKAHIGPMVTIDDVYPNFVIIEDGVSIAGQNFILTHNKPLAYHKNLSEAFLAPVHIKKNAWVAIGVIILPGVTIGEGAIVASGAVVAKDVPPNTLVGGIPAKVIKEFDMKDGIPIGFKK
jgi:acetyltransferase-like isoleucine patch superfamily enzyme